MGSTAPPALIAVILVGGCTVGPDYAGPPVTASGAFARPDFVRADQVIISASPPSRWWEAFHDPMLTTLIDKAFNNSPSIDLALAHVEEARAMVRSTKSASLPSANAQATYVYAQIPGAELRGPARSGATGPDTDVPPSAATSDDRNRISFYNAGFDASWQVDLFGGGRRSVEQAQATAEARLADLADIRVALAADVARAYAGLRGLQQQRSINEQSSQLVRQITQLTQQRYDRGTISVLELEHQQAYIDNNASQNIFLKSAIEANLNELAVLTGQEPGSLDVQLAEMSDVPLPPATVAVGNPVELLTRRPDIRAAERNLAAYNAAIGVKAANRLPRINFLGLLGIGGTRIEDLTKLDGFATILAPRLSWNVLDFGGSRAAVDRATTQKDAAAATYRMTVLNALRDAEDTLSRYRASRARAASLARSERSASRAAILSQDRLRAGTSSMIDQLNIENERLLVQSELVKATVQMTTDFIAIQKSLGLGWQDMAGSQ